MSADLAINRNKPYWWRALTDVDPITLEPLKRLRHPPFELRANETVVTWFDGHVLATYLISTGNFSHPISRRELTRSECIDLDAHLVQHNLGKPNVTHAFDHKEDYGKKPTRENHVANLQAAATEVLNSLFAGGGAAGGRSDADASAAAERAAVDAARSVDPSRLSDELHFPVLSEQAAAAVAAARAGMPLTASSTWGSASPAVTSGALRGPAARVNIASNEHFPSLGGEASSCGAGELPGGAGATSGWSATAAARPAASPAGSAAAVAAAGTAAARPPTAADFPALGGGAGKGAAPRLNGCSSRAPWVETAAAAVTSSSTFSKKAGALPPDMVDYGPPPSVRPQAPPRIDDEGGFPGLAAPAPRAGGGRASGGNKQTAQHNAMASLEQRTREVVARLQSAFAGGTGGAKGTATVADVRRLCGALQAGEMAPESFVAQFATTLGARAAAAALLPEVAALCPDQALRDALGVQYARAGFLRAAAQ